MRMIDNEGLAKLKWSLGECFESGVVGNGIIALNPSPNLFGRSNRPPPPIFGGPVKSVTGRASRDRS